MRLEFEYTADDLREAMTTAQLASMRSTRASYIRVAISLASMFGYAEILSYLVRSHGDSQALTFVILPLIPLALMLMDSWLDVYLQASGKAIKPWEVHARKSSIAFSRVARWGRLVLWVLVLLYACVFPFVVERQSEIAPDNALFVDGIFAGVAVSCLFSLWVNTTNLIRARARGVWESQKQLHGPFCVDIDEQNILISGAQWRSRLKWTAFQGFTETPNLIILYLSTTAFHMLPKRAIASEAELNELSRILVQYVQHGHLFPRPSAFPVSPIPAIPVETAQESQG